MHRLWQHHQVRRRHQPERDCVPLPRGRHRCVHGERQPTSGGVCRAESRAEDICVLASRIHPEDHLPRLVLGFELSRLLIELFMFFYTMGNFSSDCHKQNVFYKDNNLFDAGKVFV